AEPRLRLPATAADPVERIMDVPPPPYGEKATSPPMTIFPAFDASEARLITLNVTVPPLMLNCPPAPSTCVVCAVYDAPLDRVTAALNSEGTSHFPPLPGIYPIVSEPPAILSGCCVYSLRTVRDPLEIVTAPPPEFCSFTQSRLWLFGRRGAGPVDVSPAT